MPPPKSEGAASSSCSSSTSASASSKPKKIVFHTPYGQSPVPRPLNVAPPPPGSEFRRWSCEQCRARKIKCDGVRPTCGYCAKNPARVCLYLGQKVKTQGDDDGSGNVGAGEQSNPSSSSSKSRKKRPRDTDTSSSQSPQPKSHVKRSTSQTMSDLSTTSAQPQPNTPPIGLQHPPHSQYHPQQQQQPLYITSESALTRPSNQPLYMNTSESTSSRPPIPSPISRPPPIPPPISTRQPPHPHPHPIDTTNIIDFLEDHAEHITTPNGTTLRRMSVISNLNRPMDRNEVRRLVEAFFAVEGFTLISFIHKRSVLMNVETVDEFLLMAIASAGVLIESRPSPELKRSLLRYYELARNFALEALERPSLQNLQALLLMSTVSAYINKQSAGWMFLGMACRMALLMRLNCDPDNAPLESNDPSYSAPLDWVEAETRRRLGWACFLRDKIHSSFADRSTFFGKVPIDLKPVCPEHIWESMVDPSILSQTHRIPTSTTIPDPISPSQPLVPLVHLFYQIVGFVHKARIAGPAPESIFVSTGMTSFTSGSSTESLVNNTRTRDGSFSPVLDTLVKPFPNDIDIRQYDSEFLQLRLGLADWRRDLPPHLKIPCGSVEGVVEWFKRG
ncbi:hypothetical protein HDU76_007864, partial [Blyttiomyces sp. JEL0837]